MFTKKVNIFARIRKKKPKQKSHTSSIAIDTRINLKKKDCSLFCLEQYT